MEKRYRAWYAAPTFRLRGPAHLQRCAFLFPISRRRILLLVLVLNLALSRVTYASTAEFQLINPGSSAPPACSTITLEVRATFDTCMSGASFQIGVSADSGVIVTGRAVASALTFLGTNPAEPFAFELPRPLGTAEPLDEVLIGLRQAWRPGVSGDGIDPGADVLLETLTLEIAGEGLLTISIASPAAVETQSDPAGRLFDSVTIAPAGGAVTLSVQARLVRADFDGDCDVDTHDLSLFKACSRGAMIPPGSGCASFDLDSDNDVDADDFGIFQRCYRGTGVCPDPACMY